MKRAVLCQKKLEALCQILIIQIKLACVSYYKKQKVMNFFRKIWIQNDQSS
uniref:Uncharacterized protein n=1 Tax=Arundo donax TaxID=35708 RepID=A0A0A9CWY4_ARUDO